jgi:hypothetical protein
VSLPQVVVDTLYASPATGPDSSSGPSSSSSSGHTFLRETVQAIVAGIRNPAHLELSISAVQLLGGCGVRLAAYEDAGGKEEAPSAAVASAPGGVDLGGLSIGCIRQSTLQCARYSVAALLSGLVRLC